MTSKNLNMKTIGLSVAVIVFLSSTNYSMAMESSCTSEHPKTILPGGLKEIESGLLYVGENITPNGTPIYYAYEKVDESNFDFWSHYEQRSSRISQIFTSLCRYSETPKKDEDREFFQTIFDFTSEELDIFCRKLAPKLIRNEVFTGRNSMHNGIAGMWQALKKSTNEVQKYVFYASKLLVTKRFKAFEPITYLDSTHNHLEKSLHVLNQFKRQFGTIIMSCVATTSTNYVPCLHHFGVFKNPLSVIDLKNNYKDISMQLHGFSAVVQLSFFEGREFMETTPIDSMKNIMINKGVPIEGKNVKVDLKALAKFYNKDLT